MQKSVVALDLARSDFVRVLDSDSVSGLAALFLKSNQNHALVFDEAGVYLGVSSKDWLLKKHTDLKNAKIRNLVKKGPVVFADDGLPEVARLMVQSEARILPVFNNKKLAGAVLASDVVREAEKVESLRSLRVKDVASKTPVLLSENAAVEQAISLMRERKVNRLPLVSKNGQLSGLFSFSDLVRHVALHEHERPQGRKGERSFSEASSVLSTPVKVFSSFEPFVVASDESLANALRRMRQKNVSCLVLVDRDKPVGILTTRDLLRLFSELDASPRKISFSNKPALDEIDSSVLDKTVSDFFDKVATRFSPDVLLSVHFKELQSKGAHKKHDVHVHLSGPGLKLSAHHVDWKLLTAVQGALKAMQSELRKKKR